MTTELRFYKKSVYGNELVYPVPNIAKQFKMLTGKKTASDTQLKALKDLGFEIAINDANFNLTYY